ncbi:MAG: type III PLP-dependent enzyme, partial [Tabrizicola sp.]|nr:type III PLP-dependent enzyme [Tabrizicola sp.]
ALIDSTTTEAFGPDRPALVCEPGRALCGDAFAVAARVKGLRDGSHVFLNDGIYGSLAELPMIGVIDRYSVLCPLGTLRQGAPVPRVIFGPTCDSVDRLPGELLMPSDLSEGDYVVWQGMGSYSTATNTRFNGFGDLQMATVLSLNL